MYFLAIFGLLTLRKEIFNVLLVLRTSSKISSYNLLGLCHNSR